MLSRYTYDRHFLSSPLSLSFTSSFIFRKIAFCLLASLGVSSLIGECQWLHLDLISNLMRFNREMYPAVAYAYTCIPTYPSGQIGFVLCSKNASTVFETPLRTLSQEQVRDLPLLKNSD